MPSEYRGPHTGGDDSRRRRVPRWEEDFPIQAERDHYVTRREFAKFLTLGSALLAAANVVIAFVGLRPKKEQARAIMIAQASSIPLGGSSLFRYPTEQDPCILLRSPAGEFLA